MIDGRGPLGQMVWQPRRTQDAHGTFLSHFSFSLDTKHQESPEEVLEIE